MDMKTLETTGSQLGDDQAIRGSADNQALNFMKIFDV